MAANEQTYSDDESIDIRVRRVVNHDLSPAVVTTVRQRYNSRERLPLPTYLQPEIVVERVVERDVRREDDLIREAAPRGQHAHDRERRERRERRRTVEVEQDRRRLEELRARAEDLRRRERQEMTEENYSLESVLARIQQLERKRDIDEIRWQKRMDDMERERIRASRYEIMTSKRDDNRTYDLIDLRTSHQFASDTQRWREVPHDVFDAHRGRDLIFEMEFPLQLDYTREVEHFSRLKRHGNFALARGMFKEKLQDHMDHPFMFTQYAELLFEMGDYKSLRLLDPKPAFGYIPEHKLRAAAFDLRQLEGGWGRFIYLRKRNIGKDAHQPNPDFPESPPAEDETPEDLHNLGLHESRLLHLKWRLLQSLAIFHDSGTINEALVDAKTALHSLVIHDEVGSTELQVMCLALQAFSHVRSTVPDIFHLEVESFCLGWAAWPVIYHALIDEDRVWDFRDLFTATSACFGVETASLLFFGKGRQRQLRDTILSNWGVDETDEAKSLAQLDIILSEALSRLPYAPVPKSGRKANKSLVQRLSKLHPAMMGTRPILKWMLLEAYESSFPEGDPFVYLKYCPGLVLPRKGPLSLPVYIPFELEVPGWFIPREVPKDAREAVKVTLKQASQVEDCITQVLCLQLLIMQTPDDPADLLAQLGELQKKQMGDRHGYLSTLLSSYLHACGSKEREARLLGELKQVDNWTEANALRDADLHLAKQQMERVLRARIYGNYGYYALTPPLRLSAVMYYPWLSEAALKFVRRSTLSEPSFPSSAVASSYGTTSDTSRSSRSRRSQRSPPRMSGAMPAEDGTEDRVDNGPEVEEHHTVVGAANEDRGSNNGRAAASQITITIPGGILPRQRVHVTLDRNGNLQEHGRAADLSVSPDRPYEEGSPRRVGRPVDAETVVSSEGSIRRPLSDEGTIVSPPPRRPSPLMAAADNTRSLVPFYFQDIVIHSHFTTSSSSSSSRERRRSQYQNDGIRVYAS